MFEKENNPYPSHVPLSASGRIFIADWVSRGHSLVACALAFPVKPAVSLHLAASVTPVAFFLESIDSVSQYYVPGLENIFLDCSGALAYAKASNEIFSCLK